MEYNSYTMNLDFILKQRKYCVILMMTYLSNDEVYARNMHRFCDFQKMFFSFFLFFEAPAFSAYSSWELCEGSCQCMSRFWGKLSQNMMFWGGSLPKNCLPTISLKISNWVLPKTVTLPNDVFHFLNFFDYKMCFQS